MAKTKIKLNYAGVGSLLKSEEMQGLLGQLAGQVAARAAGESDVYLAQTRAVASVCVQNDNANMDNNTLLKALR